MGEQHCGNAVDFKDVYVGSSPTLPTKPQKMRTSATGYKRRIAREVYPYNDFGWDYYQHLHQFSKNKIHCSRPLCSAKTRNKGKRRKNCHGFSPSINYKPSDMRKIVAMDMDEQEVDIRNFDFSENS